MHSVERSSTHPGWPGTTQWAAAVGPGKSPLSPCAVRPPVPRGMSLLVPLWPWEDDDTPPFPSMGRVQVSTPETLAAVRRRIDVRPFGLILEGHTRREGDPAPIALDPGTDLSEWQSLDWRDGAAGLAHIEPDALDNLGGKAHGWLRPRPLDDTSSYPN